MTRSIAANGKSKIKPPPKVGRFDDASITNALPHPLIIVDRDSQIQFANSAAENFFQISAPILCRQHLSDIVAFGSPLLALVEQVCRTGASVNEYGIDMGTPRIGEDRLVDVYAGELPDDPDRILVILQQRSMAQMIERQFTHRAAAKSVSGMAAVLAHEIKNPLSGIRGAAQLLESNIEDRDRNLTQLICSETDRICKLVDRMEIFGDERPVTLEPVNIHAVLDHVKGLATNGFAKSITIREDYDPSLPTVPGNRDKLIQAFLNLVKNAAEAIEPDRSDGRIVLSTAFRPGVRFTVPGTRARTALPLQISIEDNGTGVPDDMKAHLFDPFVTTKQQGTGLGLALVAKIIGDHGGVIECDTQPSKTIFRALLPMYEPSKGNR